MCVPLIQNSGGRSRWISISLRSAWSPQLGTGQPKLHSKKKTKKNYHHHSWGSELAQCVKELAAKSANPSSIVRIHMVEENLLLQAAF